MEGEGPVHFVSGESVREDAELAFERHRRRLAELLPSADIQHIGSTAVPGAVTKGDLDIQVRVPLSAMVEADLRLSRLYERNTGSIRVASFSSFKDDAEVPPLGVQLTAIGSQFDDFILFRDRLRSDGAALLRYNELKRACEGMDMDEYRRRKGELVEEILALARHDDDARAER